MEEEIQERNKDRLPNSSRKQLDIPNWYYCSLWWKQYLFWQYYFNNSPNTVPPYNYQPYSYTTPRPGITVQIRLTNGMSGCLLLLFHIYC